MHRFSVARGSARQVPTDPDAPLVSARGLVAGYGSQEVCGPLDLELRAGDSVGVVGSNAVGKSTLLRTLIGRQPPVDGAARVLGVFSDDSSHVYRRRVAAVFDEDAYFPSLTVAEHLQLVASGHGVTESADAVADELEFFGLVAARDAFPGHLSSGQRRRLLLAAAMVRPFDLLVLDEPEQRLDSGMRSALAARLRDLRDAGAGLLLATHDAGLLTTVAHSAVVLDGGVRRATPDDAATAIGRR